MRGDSLHLQGDLTVNGTLNYSGTLQRKIFFTGSNSQIVQNAAGTISIYNCEISKGANNVTVNKDITIDNNLNFVSRRFFTNNTPNGLMILSALATATGASNISFVHGPCRKIGNTAFTFPIGKSNYYRQCSLGAGGVGGTTVFGARTSIMDVINFVLHLLMLAQMDHGALLLVRQTQTVDSPCGIIFFI